MSKWKLGKILHSKKAHYFIRIKLKQLFQIKTKQFKSWFDTLK